MHNKNYNSKKKYHTLIRVFVVFLLISSTFFFGSVNKNSVNGLSILNINANSLPDQKLEGNLKISLKKGELLPKDSLLIIKNQENTYKFPIADLINDTPIEGNFYIESNSLAIYGYGYGYGYGFPGETSGYGYGIPLENQEQDGYEINIDLASLNLSVSSDELTASLEYNNTEIISTTTKIQKVDLTNTISTNITINETLTNITTDTNDSDPYKLTEDELNAIKLKTGQEQVKITKSQEFKGRLIIRFEIGNYWLENSYGYTNQDNENLKKQIEIDRKIWTKNLAKEFLKTTETPNNVEYFIGNYSLS